MKISLKQKFMLINLALALLIIVGDFCYTFTGGLWIKGLTSAGFVALGAINLLYVFKTKLKDRNFAIIMLVGLFFACLGDIVLNIHFISGAILFAIGHVFYFVSYCFLLKFKWLDLAYGAAIFLPSVLLITLAPFFNFGGILMEIICIMYALIISCMVGKAVSNLVRKQTILNILLTMGSVLFFFSDLMLLLNVFGDLPRIVDVLCLATYYPAQILLAYSLLETSQDETIDNSQNLIN